MLPHFRFLLNRAFSVIAPILWNKLPAHIHNTHSLDQFKTLLKTHLFNSLMIFYTGSVVSRSKEVHTILFLVYLISFSLLYMHDLLKKEQIYNSRVHYKFWLVICRQTMMRLEKNRIKGLVYYYSCYSVLPWGHCLETSFPYMVHKYLFKENTGFDPNLGVLSSTSKDIVLKPFQFKPDPFGLRENRI